MKNLYFLAFSSLILLGSGCCRDKTKTLIAVDTDLRGLMPYTSGQQIALLRDTDTLRLTATTMRDSINLACDGDCCEEFYQEIYTVALNKTDQTEWIKITAEGTTLVFKVGNTNFVNLELNESKGVACGGTTGVICLDSLAVGSQVYRNVWRLNPLSNNTDNIAKYLYYNKVNGVIKVEATTGADYILP